jgi:hypothetical protein
MSMEQQIEWVASRVRCVGPVLATFALLALAIVLAACGPGSGGASGY